jgi:predicted ABC-type ATPase
LEFICVYLNTDANANTNLQLQQQNSNGQRDGESSPLADSLADLELISGLIRTLSMLVITAFDILGETTFNRRNLRRRILQQRTNGFNMDVNESLEILRQNTRNIETLLTSAAKPSEIPHHDTGKIIMRYQSLII